MHEYPIEHHQDYARYPIPTRNGCSATATPSYDTCAVHARSREIHVDRAGNEAVNAKRIGAVDGPLRVVDGVIVWIEHGGDQFHGPGHFGNEREDGEVEPNGAVVDVVEDAVRGGALCPRIDCHRFGNDEGQGHGRGEGRSWADSGQ